MNEPQKITEIGDKMPDGTIYAGKSPTTGKDMYAAPMDAPIRMDFNRAAEYAKGLQVGDKKDFRLPDEAELKYLYENRNKGALRGTFKQTCDRFGFYWSSTRCDSDAGMQAWMQGNGTKKSTCLAKFMPVSVRCVR